MLTIEADILAVLRRRQDSYVGLRELRPAMIRPPEVVNEVTDVLDRLVAQQTLLVRSTWAGHREWKINPEILAIVPDEDPDADESASDSAETKALYIMILRSFKRADDHGETMTTAEVKAMYADHNPVLVAWAFSKLRVDGQIEHCKGTSGKGARYHLSGGRAVCPVIEVRQRAGNMVRELKVREPSDG